MGYNPSGKLTFEIDEYCDGCQTKWTDKAQLPLEDQLNEVLAGLILAGESMRLRTIEREVEQRRQREQERRRMEDQERRHYLSHHLESWSESQRLREFLRACEASLIDRKGGLETDTSEAKWLRWAHRYADRIDPLKNGSFEEVIVRLIKKARGQIAFVTSNYKSNGIYFLRPIIYVDGSVEFIGRSLRALTVQRARPDFEDFA